MASNHFLKEFTGKVTTRRTKGEHRGARQEMVERLLFDGVDTEPAGAPISGENDGIIFTGAYETQAALPFMQGAVARAQLTAYAAVLKVAPEPSGNSVLQGFRGSVSIHKHQMGNGG